MALTYNETFDTTLRKLIAEHIEEVKEGISRGMMEPDEYKRNAGIIQGLNKAIELCDTTNTRLQER